MDNLQLELQHVHQRLPSSSAIGDDNEIVELFVKTAHEDVNSVQSSDNHINRQHKEAHNEDRICCCFKKKPKTRQNGDKKECGITRHCACCSCYYGPIWEEFHECFCGSKMHYILIYVVIGIIIGCAAVAVASVYNELRFGNRNDCRDELVGTPYYLLIPSLLTTAALTWILTTSHDSHPKSRNNDDSDDENDDDGDNDENEIDSRGNSGLNCECCYSKHCKKCCKIYLLVFTIYKLIIFIANLILDIWLLMHNPTYLCYSYMVAVSGNYKQYICVFLIVIWKMIRNERKFWKYLSLRSKIWYGLVYLLGTIYFPVFLIHGVLPFLIFIIIAWCVLIIVYKAYEAKCCENNQCRNCMNNIDAIFNFDYDCDCEDDDDAAAAICILCCVCVSGIGLILCILLLISLSYTLLPRKIAETVDYSLVFTFVAFGIIWSTEFIPNYVVSQDYTQFISRDFAEWWNREDTLQTWQTIAVWILTQLS